MSLFLPGNIGFHGLSATTLGSRAAAADRLAIIARNARPDAPAAIRMLAPARPLSQVLLVPGRARLVTTSTNGHSAAKLVSRPQRGAMFGEPHVRSIEIGRRARGGFCLSTFQRLSNQRRV